MAKIKHHLLVLAVSTTLIFMGSVGVTVSLMRAALYALFVGALVFLAYDLGLSDREKR